MRSGLIWRAAVGLTIAMSMSCMMFGQDGQGSSAPSSTATGSPLPALPDSGPSFPPPSDTGSPTVMQSGRGFRQAGRGFGVAGGDPLFPSGPGTFSTRAGNSATGNSSGSGSTSGASWFDWTRFFTDAARSGFQFAAPRLFAPGGQSGVSGPGSAPDGLRPMAGSASIFALGDGLLRSAGAASSGALGSSLDLLSEAAQIERRGLNLSLNDLDKNSDLGLRFSFKEMMVHDSLLGGGGNSFGSFSSFSTPGSNGWSGGGNAFGSSFGGGPGGGRRGGGAGSQVSVQLKF